MKQEKSQIDEESAAIVRKIFEMLVADNTTMADIIRYLNRYAD